MTLHEIESDDYERCSHEQTATFKDIHRIGCDKILPTFVDTLEILFSKPENSKLFTNKPM
jgi:hypothetical protein